jgi:hypothetical protein
MNPGLMTPIQIGLGFNTNPQGFNGKYVKANTIVFDVNVAEEVLVNPAMQTSVANQFIQL